MQQEQIIGASVAPACYLVSSSAPHPPPHQVSAYKLLTLTLAVPCTTLPRPQREEKDALADSVRGDIVTSLLPVVDNFELARTQVKAETEAELKIQNSYQVSARLCQMSMG